MPKCLSQRQPTLRPSTQVVTPGTSPGTPCPPPQQYSTYFPSNYPGSPPRYLPQVLLHQTTALAGWWQCFLKLLLYFCRRSLSSISGSSSSSLSRLQKYENTRSLGALRAPTSSWRPFGHLTSSFAPFRRSGRVTQPSVIV